MAKNTRNGGVALQPRPMDVAAWEAQDGSELTLQPLEVAARAADSSDILETAARFPEDSVF